MRAYSSWSAMLRRRSLNWVMSAPATKAWSPAPRRTTTRMASSLDRSCTYSGIICHISRLTAFRFSGWLKMIQPIGPSLCSKSFGVSLIGALLWSDVRAMYRVQPARRKLSAGRRAVGLRLGVAGVEMTTRHALAPPGRLGSIRARYARRPLGGNGSLRPPPHPAATRLPVAQVVDSGGRQRPRLGVGLGDRSWGVRHGSVAGGACERSGPRW